MNRPGFRGLAAPQNLLSKQHNPSYTPRLVGGHPWRLPGIENLEL